MSDEEKKTVEQRREIVVNFGWKALNTLEEESKKHETSIPKDVVTRFIEEGRKLYKDADLVPAKEKTSADIFKESVEEQTEAIKAIAELQKEAMKAEREERRQLSQQNERLISALSKLEHKA